MNLRFDLNRIFSMTNGLGHYKHLFTMYCKLCDAFNLICIRNHTCAPVCALCALRFKHCLALMKRVKNNRKMSPYYTHLKLR